MDLYVSMHKTFFKNLSEREQGKFYFHDKDIRIGGGTRSPNVIYLVKFHYKGNDISVINKTGTVYLGTITCSFASTLRPVGFKLNSMSHFMNLFYRRKSRFKIVSKNPNVKHFITNNAAFKTLNSLAEKDDFSPYMICNPKENYMETKYHLEFDEWTDAIDPIIALYKNLIDEFERGALGVSLRSYRER